MNMEQFILPNVQEEFLLEKNIFESNLNEVQTLLMAREGSEVGLPEKVDALLLRIARLLPDATKLARMDGRTAPLKMQLGHSAVELLQSLHTMISHM